MALDLGTKARRILPLSQASEGSFDATGKTLYFVRPAFHNNVTKRYRGGTARRIWKFTEGAPEAACLTCDYAGESHSPMWWGGRVYFVSDRDGTMNLWSMDESGHDLRQHTHHSGWDVRDPALDRGRVVYQVGADLWLYDIGSGKRAAAADPPRLRLRPAAGEVGQEADGVPDLRAPSPEGRLAWCSPPAGGCSWRPRPRAGWCSVSREPGVRYRDVVFLPDGKRCSGSPTRRASSSS